MNLIEQFRGFCAASYGKLSAAELGLYLRLLSIWNEAGRPEWITVPYSAIQASVKAGSHNTIKKWREGLEAGGFIETRSQGERKPIQVRLISFPSMSKIDIDTPSAMSKTDIVAGATMSKIDIDTPSTMSKTDIALCQKLTYTMSKIDIAEASVTPRDDTDEALPRKGLRPAPAMSKNDPHREREIITEDIERGKDSILLLDTGDPPGGAAPSLPLPQKILNLYQEQIRPICSRDEQADLQALCEEYGTKRIEVAVNKAAERGKRSLAYVRGILKNWSDADDKQQQRPSKTARKVRQPTAEEERAKWNAEAERVARYESESGHSSSRRD